MASCGQQWDPYFVEGQHLRNVQENLDLLRLVFSSGAGPLFRNREFIVYERRETMDDGTQVHISGCRTKCNSAFQCSQSYAMSTE